MRKILISAGCTAAWLATLSPLAAQGDAATRGVCVLDMERLLADPPRGIPGFGAAVRSRDAALEPAKQEMDPLIDRIAEAYAARGRARAAGDAALAESLTAQIGALTDELDDKAKRLEGPYNALTEELVAPVEAVVDERARTFALARGCADVQIASGESLAESVSAGGEDVTADFVAWYLTNPPT